MFLHPSILNLMKNNANDLSLVKTQKIKLIFGDFEVCLHNLMLAQQLHMVATLKHRTVQLIQNAAF